MFFVCQKINNKNRTLRKRKLKKKNIRTFVIEASVLFLLQMAKNCNKTTTTA